MNDVSSEKVKKLRAVMRQHHFERYDGVIINIKKSMYLYELQKDGFSIFSYTYLVIGTHSKFQEYEHWVAISQDIIDEYSRY